MIGSSHKAHVNSSLPDPPITFWYFHWQLERSFIRLMLENLFNYLINVGITFFRPKSAIKDSLWKSCLALLWLLKTIPGQLFRSSSSNWILDDQSFLSLHEQLQIPSQIALTNPHVFYFQPMALLPQAIWIIHPSHSHLFTQIADWFLL